MAVILQRQRRELRPEDLPVPEQFLNNSAATKRWVALIPIFIRRARREPALATVHAVVAMMTQRVENDLASRRSRKRPVTAEGDRWQNDAVQSESRPAVSADISPSTALSAPEEPKKKRLRLLEDPEVPSSTS